MATVETFSFIFYSFFIYFSFILFISFFYIFYRRAEDPINQLCESIGQSEKLFSAFANYCTEKAKEESNANWGRVLRSVLTSIQERKEKVRGFIFTFLFD